jgi:hypothetical protein
MREVDTSGRVRAGSFEPEGVRLPGMDITARSVFTAAGKYRRGRGQVHPGVIKELAETTLVFVLISDAS